MKFSVIFPRYTQLQTALDLLRQIEQDYRNYCSESVALCVEHPKEVKALLEKHEAEVSFF